MLICAAGDIHGKIDRLYTEVETFEHRLGRSFDLVAQVGDFGIWPDPARVDRATREHDGAGDFPLWYGVRQRAPRRTIFVKGNHEDFGFLDIQRGDEILPDLHYLRSGSAMVLDGLCVAGVGGCYSERDSDEPVSRNRQASSSHYTLAETRRLLAPGKIDVLLTHDAPGGVELGGYVVRGDALRVLVERKRPGVVFFGHHHVRARSQIVGVPVLGLAFVGQPGWLVAWDLEQGLVAEWPS